MRNELIRVKVQTDGRKDRAKLIVDFLQFCEKAPKALIYLRRLGINRRKKYSFCQQMISFSDFFKAYILCQVPKMHLQPCTMIPTITLHSNSVHILTRLRTWWQSDQGTNLEKGNKSSVYSRKFRQALWVHEESHSMLTGCGALCPRRSGPKS